MEKIVQREAKISCLRTNSGHEAELLIPGAAWVLVGFLGLVYFERDLHYLRESTILVIERTYLAWQRINGVLI